MNHISILGPVCAMDGTPPGEETELSRNAHLLRLFSACFPAASFMIEWKWPSELERIGADTPTGNALISGL